MARSKPQESRSFNISLAITDGKSVVTVPGNYVRYQFSGPSNDVAAATRAAVKAQGLPGKVMAGALPDGTTRPFYHEYVVGSLTVRSICDNAQELGIGYCTSCGAATTLGESHAAWCGTSAQVASDDDLAALAKAALGQPEPEQAKAKSSK